MGLALRIPAWDAGQEVGPGVELPAHLRTEAQAPARWRQAHALLASLAASAGPGVGQNLAGPRRWPPAW